MVFPRYRAVTESVSGICLKRVIGLSQDTDHRSMKVPTDSERKRFSAYCCGIWTAMRCVVLFPAQQYLAGVLTARSSATRALFPFGAAIHAICGFEADLIRIFRIRGVALAEFVLMMVHDVATSL